MDLIFTSLVWNIFAWEPWLAWLTPSLNCTLGVADFLILAGTKMKLGQKQQRTKKGEPLQRREWRHLRNVQYKAKFHGGKGLHTCVGRQDLGRQANLDVSHDTWGEEALQPPRRSRHRGPLLTWKRGQSSFRVSYGRHPVSILHMGHADLVKIGLFPDKGPFSESGVQFLGTWVEATFLDASVVTQLLRNTNNRKLNDQFQGPNLHCSNIAALTLGGTFLVCSVSTYFWKYHRTALKSS